MLNGRKLGAFMNFFAVMQNGTVSLAGITV